MLTKSATRRFGKLAAVAFAAATLGTVISTSAQAGSEPYLGWDFGHGVGIGVGAPPSAYDPCPSYGWSYYPYRCRYSHRHHIRHYSRH